MRTGLQRQTHCLLDVYSIVFSESCSFLERSIEDDYLQGTLLIDGAAVDPAKSFRDH